MESKDNMPTTYEKIATTTLGSAAATIDFTSISSAYTDLRLVLVCTTSVSNVLRLRYNADSANNYSCTNLIGDGFSGASYRKTNISSVELTESATVGTSTTIPQLFAVDIFSYAGSTYKTCLLLTAEEYSGGGQVQAKVGLWRSTSAINQVTLSLSSTANFNTGTTATLYGILKA